METLQVSKKRKYVGDVLKQHKSYFEIAQNF